LPDIWRQIFSHDRDEHQAHLGPDLPHILDQLMGIHVFWIQVHIHDGQVKVRPVEFGQGIAPGVGYLNLVTTLRHQHVLKHGRERLVAVYYQDSRGHLSSNANLG
jgi:hypothetical protein